MFHQSPTRSVFLVAALVGLALYAIYGGYFAREIVIEIAILAILAISLDVVAGFGGMVSLCHGAILGVSAYTYGILTAKLGYPALPSAVAAIAAAAVFGTVVGWITARTTGIYFIMATLAFGQMAYTVIFKSRWLGGDDGMGGLPRFDLDWAGIAMNKSLPFALFAVLAIFARSSSLTSSSLLPLEENDRRRSCIRPSSSSVLVGACSSSCWPMPIRPKTISLYLPRNVLAKSCATAPSSA